MAQRKYQFEEEQGKSKLLTGLFRDKQSAEGAYQAAVRCGFKPEEINIIMSKETCKKLYDADLTKLQSSTRGVEGSSIKSTNEKGILGALSAVQGKSFGTNSNFVIAGPVLSKFKGELTGGFLENLVNLGFPETIAKDYEKSIKDGGILIGVHRNTLSKDLESNWKNFNPEIMQ